MSYASIRAKDLKGQKCTCILGISISIYYGLSFEKIKSELKSSGDVNFLFEHINLKK